MNGASLYAEERLFSINVNGPCVTSSASAADGLDNDCDGVIDGEIFDGVVLRLCQLHQKG
jgi:hypothetical protein